MRKGLGSVYDKRNTVVVINPCPNLHPFGPGFGFRLITFVPYILLDLSKNTYCQVFIQ